MATASYYDYTIGSSNDVAWATLPTIKHNSSDNITLKTSSRVENILAKAKAPKKVIASIEFESDLIKYINDANSVNLSYIYYVHGLLSKHSDTKIMADIDKLIGYSNKMVTKKLIYEFSFDPTAHGAGMTNLAIIDGVLEFLPNAMMQATFLKSIMMGIYNGRSGYVIIRYYTDEMIKNMADKLKATPIDGGYLIDDPNGKTVFVKGMERRDILDIISYGRIGSVIDLSLPNHKELYICISNGSRG
jgi:hypothetical protein